ncbi:MAG: hypothetical protein UE295_09595, partial [Acutalibacteraceae bacterium]|nr:hypothetical protein [Acutalibacteraceae bacterium]
VAGSIYMTINLIAFILPGYNENALYGRSLQTMAIMLLSPFGMPIMVGEFTFTKTPYSYMGTNALADEIIIMSLWAVLTVIYFVAAMIIAKIRKNENVQSGFIFKFPKIVIQVIASVGIGLISGFVALTYLFFYDTTGTGVPTLLIFMAGALLGSLGAFIITTLVYNRGTKRFVKDLPIFGGSFALLAVFYLLISTGLVGGVMNVPDVDKIKSVSVNSPAYNTYLGVESPAFVSIGDKYEKISYQSEDKQYRESVVALHQAIVDNIHNEMGMFFNMNWIYEPFNVSFEPSNIDIVYELNNGKKIIKAYTWCNYDYEDIKDEYNGVLNTDAFKNQHKITKCDTAEEANVSMIGISQSKRYSNNPLYDTTNESDYDIGEYGATITEEEIIDTDNEKSDFYDSEFISQVYSTLRDEFVADKNLSKTMRTAKPEYVETDDVPDEIVYSVRMNYDIGDVISEDDLRKANDIEDASSVIMDSDEEYFVTKDTYPNTWKLIDDYMQSNNRTSAFIYSDAA